MSKHTSVETEKMKPVVIVKVLKKPDGGMTRTILGAAQGYGDFQAALPVLEKHLKEYAEHGYSPDEGHWARDAAGQKFTFVIH
jgi:hypothetical protein